jgi:hypothetical protein
MAQNRQRVLQRWNSHHVATEGDSNDDRDAQEQASQIQKVNAPVRVAEGLKALLGKHSWANPFAESEHRTNAAYNRGLTCQSDTFPQMVDGFYAGAMRAQ